MFFGTDAFDMPWKMYPGRKPVGLVKIDWNHPDAKGLTLCVIFQMGRYFDLVSERELFLSANTVQHPDGALFNGTDAYLTIPDVVIDSSYSITGHLYSKGGRSSDLGYCMSYGGVSVGDSFNAYLGGDTGVGNNGEFKFFSSNSNPNASLVASVKYPDAMDTVFSFAINRSLGELFVNGVSDVVNNSFANNMPDGTKNTLFVGGRVDLNAARFWAGTTKLLFIHDHKIDTAMARRLNDNSYSFIINA